MSYPLPFVSYTPLHTHLSSVHLPPVVVPVPSSETTQDEEPTSSSSARPHPSHALHASADAQTGLLVRVINNGLTVELSSIAPTKKGKAASSVVALARPVRFIFPSALLPSPTVFASPATRYIHILALTESGYLHRLSFPASTGSAASGGPSGARGSRSTSSWEAVLDSGDWADEYNVQALQHGRTTTVFHAADEQTVIVGTADGTMVRLDRDQGSWSETELRPSSYLSTFTSLLPSFSSSPSVRSPSSTRRAHTQSTSSEVVSLASHLQEDTLGLAFSLSRDRKLRVWNLVTGACVRTVDVPAASTSSAVVQRGGPVGGGQDHHLLPTSEDGPRSFIRVVSRKEIDDIGGDAVMDSSADASFAYYLAVFVPSASSAVGGRFVFYGIQVDASRAQVGELAFVGEKLAAVGTGGAELRDFDVLLPSPSASPQGGDEPSTIWVVWDVRGETVIQRSRVGSIIGGDDEGFDDVGGEAEDDWETLASIPTPAFNATYFEDIIRSTEPSIALDPSKLFIDHLFFPSRFSPTSLHQAIDSYIANLIATLPPSSGARPASLTTSYPSLSLRIAAVVGSAVKLETSSQTGEYLYAEFGKKVLIEWLGFLARCEEAERDARWSIGFVRTVGGKGGVESVMVAQRDGLVLPARKSSVEVVASIGSGSNTEDKEAFVALVPGVFAVSHPDLKDTRSRSAAMHLASFASSLSSALNPASMLQLEADLATLTSSPLSFSVDDVALDVYATRAEPFVSDELADVLRNGIQGGGPEFEDAVKTSIAWAVSLPGASSADGDLLSDVGVALVAAGVRTSVEVRYRLARDVLLVVLFALNELEEDAPTFASLTALVGSALTVYHSLAVLRWVSTVSPTETDDERRRASGKAPTAEESALLERFDSLKMGAGVDGSSSAHLIPPPTLLQSLLATSYSSFVTLSSTVGGPCSTIPAAASAFLSTTSLSTPSPLVAAQPQDVVLAERLLSGGHVAFAYELAGRWPTEDGLGYVRACAALGLGKVDESEEGFERVGAAFAFPASPSPTLLAVVPATLQSVSSTTLPEYYRHVSTLYEPLATHESIVRFCNLAIEAASLLSPDEFASPPKTKDLWSRLYKSTVALGRYEDAYMILTTTPHRETINDSVSHLITAMCHAGEVDRLTQFTFVGFQDVVERTLAFKARHSDPMAFPNYLLVLYAWHIRRGDYRNAASAMYQQGRRFGEVNGPFTEIGPRRAKSYLLAINALSLVDRKHAWLAVPIAPDASGKARKRRKLTSYIPEEKFSKASRGKDVEIVELEDIRREYNLVLSTLILAEKFPESFQSNVLSAEDSVALFVQAGLFDQAILTARQLQVDMTGIFERLALKTVEAQQSAAHARSLGMPESFDSLSWLLSSPLVSSLDGPSIAGRASQYVKIMLERHDGPETFYLYRKAVLEKLLEADRRLPLPTWLVAFFAANDPEHLIQTCLKYDLYEQAVKLSLDLVRQAPSPDLLPSNGQASTTYLPYNLFDVVLKVVREAEDGAANDKTRSEADVLERVIKRRIGALEGLGKKKGGK